MGDSLVGQRAKKEIKAAASSRSARARRSPPRRLPRCKKANVEAIEIIDDALEGAFAAADIVDPATGEVLLEANEELTAARALDRAGEEDRPASRSSSRSATRWAPIISTTLRKDAIKTHEEALIEIYRRLRPGDPPTLDSSRSLFENMFFNPQKYDFSRVGPAEAEHEAAS